MPSVRPRSAYLKLAPPAPTFPGDSVRGSLMSHVRRLFLSAAVLAGVLAPTATAAQHRFVHPGERVRVSWLSPASGTREWLYGTTHQATSRLFAVIPDGEQDASVMMLSPFSRVQVLDGRRSPTVLGAGIGLALGALAGGTVLSDVMGSRQITETRATAQSVAVFGLVGGAIGGLIASRFGSDRWTDVPLEDGRLVFPSFSDTLAVAGSAALNRGQRWRRFDPTEENFTAFFAEYADSLHPLEGIWREVGAPERVAIIRDARFADYRYVVVNLFVEPGSIERPGRIVGAARVGDAPGNFELIALGEQMLADRARLRGRDLIVDARGGGGTRWTKVHP